MLRNHRYSTASIAPTVKDSANAKVVTSFAIVRDVNKAPGKFEFIGPDNTENPNVASDAKALTEALQKAKSIVLSNEELDNGATVARALAVLSDGSQVRLRCFGNGRGETVNAGPMSADDIKKAVGGYCKQDGEIVAEKAVYYDKASDSFYHPAIPYIKVA